MKRSEYIPALDLNKERLQEIEKEISSPWIELCSEIEKKLKSKFSSHNAQVRKSGSSYIFSTDNSISRKLFTQKEIDSLIKDQKSSFFKKELDYPKKPPVISYKGNKFETGDLATIDELYRCNLNSNFKEIKIEIWGLDDKHITLTFSSGSSVLNFSEGNKIEVTFPEDESVGVIERIKSFLKNYEAPRSTYHSTFFKILFQLVIPFIAVFAFNKIYKIIAPIILEQDLFYTFLSMFLYFVILLLFLVYCDKLYNSIFPNTILTDRISDKRKWLMGEGLLFVLGILGIDYIISFVKWAFSLFKQ